MKTIDLAGDALDWAVGVAEGEQLTVRDRFPCVLNAGGRWNPSSNWSQGGPIIDRIEGLVQKTWLESNKKTRCEAHIINYEGGWVAFGPTPLVAAMRCYCCATLGDEIEIPEELQPCPQPKT